MGTSIEEDVDVLSSYLLELSPLLGLRSPAPPPPHTHTGTAWAKYKLAQGISVSFNIVGPEMWVCKEAAHGNGQAEK